MRDAIVSGTGPLLFNNTIFREEALARRSRQEPLDGRLQVTAPHEWMMLAGLGVAVLALLAWGLFGSVERTVSFDAVLIHPGARHAVLAPAAGTAVGALVQVGDTIVAGQPIARIRVPGAPDAHALGLRSAAPATGEEPAADSAAVELLKVLLAARGAGFVEQDVVSPYGGELVALHLAPEGPVTAGAPLARVRAAAGGPLEALAFVAPHEAARLAAGMRAAVRVAAADGAAGPTFPAQVTEVSARPVTPPAWLYVSDLALPDRPHLIRVAVPGEEPRRQVPDGTGGSLRIVLGQAPLLSLLRPRG